MSEQFTRRDLLHKAARGSVLATLGGGAGFLVKKANGQVVWQVDAARCLNSRLGEVSGEGCRLCTSECVVALSAVRAVNEISKCRSEEHTSELQSLRHLVCRLLLEKKK